MQFLCRMSIRRVYSMLVFVSGLAGIFYYSLHGPSFLTSSVSRPYGYATVNGVDVVSFTEFLSESQHLGESINHKKQGRVFNTEAEELPHRKAADNLRLLAELTNSTNKWVGNSMEDLEYYTISKPSKEKIYKFISDEQLEAKFLKNDERSIERILNGIERRHSEEKNEVFRKIGQPKKHFPSVIITGVKKGGTRALLEMLKLHPQVCACGPEMHFFDRYYHKGLQWYREKMPLCYDNELTVEKTPSYFVTSGVAKDMFAYSKSLNHRLKLLVIVRDPTTRSLSDYAQTLYKLQAKKTIRKNMSYEKLALRETTNGSKTVNDRWGAIKIGVYSKHLRRWLNYFPLEQIHLVSGEALVHKPYPEIKKVERFLGLPSFIKREQFVYNKAKKFYCFNRSLSYESPGPSEAPRCLGTTKGRLHPKISYETEKLLRDYFRPFNKELYDLTGRNFGWR